VTARIQSDRARRVEDRQGLGLGLDLGHTIIQRSDPECACRKTTLGNHCALSGYHCSCTVNQQTFSLGTRVKTSEPARLYTQHETRYMQPAM
jgi:hypothetical protein